MVSVSAVTVHVGCSRMSEPSAYLVYIVASNGVLHKLGINGWVLLLPHVPQETKRIK